MWEATLVMDVYATQIEVISIPASCIVDPLTCKEIEAPSLLAHNITSFVVIVELFILAYKINVPEIKRFKISST